VLATLLHHRNLAADNPRVTRIYTDDADLYDIAFDWDISEEVDWLLERLGPGCRTVLEPGCGSGRMLEALAGRGREVTGIDLSEQMLELARRRLSGRGTVVLADMTDFDLRAVFDGAVCPINTLTLLSPDGLARHLNCMDRHLRPGSRYMVQVGLVEPEQWERYAGSHWEAVRGGTELKIDWVDEELDVARGISRQRSRIEVLAGERAGEVLEEVHEMTAWTPESWAETVAASPFSEAATYDGGRKGRWPSVSPTATGGLLWHELVR
jgi:SAM-dependent methyltransferase